MQKIFLPKWIAWFVLLLTALVIGFAYYQAYYLHETKKSDFWFFAIIMLAVLAVVVYAVYRPLPYLLLQGVKK